MKKLHLLAVAALASSLCMSAQARNTEHNFPIKNVLENPNFQDKLNANIKLVFGKPVAANATVVGEGEYKTAKKTNSFNKTDQEACDWAFLSAIMALQSKAASLNADTVTNIKSFDNNGELSSDSEYRCRAGAMVSGVSLKGTMVKSK